LLRVRLEVVANGSALIVTLGLEFAFAERVQIELHGTTLTGERADAKELELRLASGRSGLASPDAIESPTATIT
jgi:hypothetical protein